MKNIPKEEANPFKNMLPLTKVDWEKFKKNPIPNKKEEPKQETLEYGLLQHIKMCLECNNESQAIRLLEKYGFEKQEEMYSEEEVIDIFFLGRESLNKSLITKEEALEMIKEFKKK